MADIGQCTRIYGKYKQKLILEIVIVYSIFMGGQGGAVTGYLFYFYLYLFYIIN